MSLLLLIGGLFLFPQHAIYLSLTEVETAAEGYFTVRSRLFKDDLEDALRHHTGYRKPLSLPLETEGQKALESYLESAIQVWQEGQRVALQMEKVEVEEEVVWCSLRGVFPSVLGEVKLQNTLLTELFPTQNNLVKVQRQGKSTLHFRMSKTAREISFRWED